MTVPTVGCTSSAERRIWRLCALRARRSASNGRWPGRPRGGNGSTPSRTYAAAQRRPPDAFHTRPRRCGTAHYRFRQVPGSARHPQACVRGQHQPLAPLASSQLGEAVGLVLPGALVAPAVRLSRFWFFRGPSLIAGAGCFNPMRHRLRRILLCHGSALLPGGLVSAGKNVLALTLVEVKDPPPKRVGNTS
jgi:hypothetical protein